MMVDGRCGGRPRGPGGLRDVTPDGRYLTLALKESFEKQTVKVLAPKKF